MKRYLLLIFVILLCTGCKADYYLDIDTYDRYNEKTVLSGSDKFSGYKEFLPINIFVDEAGAFEKKSSDIEYYSIDRSDNELSFSYSFDRKKINDGYIANSCFKRFGITKRSVGDVKDAELIVSTSKGFNCFDIYEDLDEVNIVLTSKYKLKDSNADSVEKHKYIWNINKNNANDKYIYLELDITNKELSIWDRFLNGEYWNAFTISLVLFVIGGIIFYILKIKNEWRNRV